jgi:hypothetical protein
MGVTVLAMVGIYLNIDYLEIPFSILIIGFIPAMAGIAWSPGFASFYLRTHRFASKIWPSNRDKKIVYSIESKYTESDPKILWPATLTMFNIFGMAYVMYSILQLFQPDAANVNSRFAILVGFAFFSFILSSAFNVSSWLLKTMGVMVSDEREGEKRNLGKDLRSKLIRVFGISAVFSFGYQFYTSGDYSGIGLSLALLTFFYPSIILSYYVLKKKHFEKLKENIRKKIISHIDEIN